MERASIESAIKLIIAEIHTRLNEATRIAKAAEACVQNAQLVRVLRSPWISSSLSMRPGDCRMQPRCSAACGEIGIKAERETARSPQRFHGPLMTSAWPDHSSVLRQLFDRLADKLGSRLSSLYRKVSVICAARTDGQTHRLRESIP